MFMPVNMDAFCEFVVRKCKYDQEKPILSVGRLPSSEIDDVRWMADVYNSLYTSAVNRIFKICGDKQIRIGDFSFIRKDVEDLVFAVTLLRLHEATEDMIKSVTEERRKTNIIRNILTRSTSIQSINVEINIE